MGSHNQMPQSPAATQVFLYLHWWVEVKGLWLANGGRDCVVHEGGSARRRLRVRGREPGEQRQFQTLGFIHRP